MALEITREDLIKICDDAVVPVEKWSNRDTPSAQLQLGECAVLIKAGCDFTAYCGDGRVHKGNMNTIEVHVFYPGFDSFEYGRDGMDEHESYYLPTRERLDRAAGGDWY